MNLRRWLILGGSIVALTLSVFLGYWWVMERPGTPSMDEPAEVEEEPPAEPDVTLPQNLREEMDQDRDRRDRLYQEALEFHRAGDLQQAVERYQDAISLSGSDHTAAESYRLLGDIYMRTDHPERALRLYEFAVQLESDNPLYRYRLGRVHEELGNVTEAAAAYERAFDLEPDGTYYLARGNLAFDQGRYEEAVGFYRDGLEASGSRTDLLVNLGFAFQQLGNRREAEEVLQEARNRELTSDLEYRVASNLGDLFMETGEVTAAINEFERAVSLRPGSESYYNLGLARLEAGLWSGAVDALEEARDRSPDDAEIRIDLGFAYQQVGNNQAAVNEYERALEMRPDDRDLYFAIARLYERLDRPTRSLVFYRELTNRLLPGPQLGLVYRRVGELYMKNNRPDSAAPAFRNALRIDTGNPEIHYNLGLSYNRMDRLENAVEEFQQAREGNSSDTHYQFVYGATLFRAGFRERSREQFLDLFERSPDRHRAGYMVAYIDYLWGRMEPSKQRFQALLADVDDPDLTASIYQNLGNIYTRQGDYSRAETVYKQALSIREDPRTYYNLGLVFAERGEWNEAHSSFRYARENGPEDPRVFAAIGLSLYERELYERAEENLNRALELDPDLTRARYDLTRVRQALEDNS